MKMTNTLTPAGGKLNTKPLMTNTQELVNLAVNEQLSYQAENKDRFHQLGRQYLRKVVKALNLQPGAYDIRSNMGGIAVSGEIILHTDTLYVCMSEGTRFYYRSCKGRKDYTGGTNQWMNWDQLLDFDETVQLFCLCGNYPTASFWTTHKDALR